jgi:UDP-glucose 4-epimerase
MRVLVTGGAGYIGATTACSLLAEGHEVLVYDNLSKGHREAVPDGALLIEGDIADRAHLDDTFHKLKPEAVLHFAGSIDAAESMQAPARYFRDNCAATLTVIEAMLANGVRKFIFSSTAALYGEPQRVPIQESDCLYPMSAYGESKLLVERMLAWFGRIHGLRYASLRYFNAAGSNGLSGECHRPESHLIPLLLLAAAGHREHISVFGTDYATPDGSCIRDYIHVIDIADAHVKVLHALSARERLIYNLGNGVGFSVREVVESARRVTGRPIKVIEADRRPGDPAVLIASSEKIRRELGWVPQYPDLDSMISSAWAWMQQSSRPETNGQFETKEGLERQAMISNSRLKLIIDSKVT